MNIEWDFILPFCLVLLIATLDIFILRGLRSGIRKQYEELKEESEQGEAQLAEYLKRTYLSNQVLDDDLDHKEIIAMAAYRFRQISKMGEPDTEAGRKLKHEGVIVLAWVGIVSAGVSIILGLVLWDSFYLFLGFVFAALLFTLGISYRIYLDMRELDRKKLKVLKDAL